MGDDGLQRFEEAFRRWAERPPETPAYDAATMVTGRLRGSSRGSVTRWLVAAAAVLAVAVTSVELSRRGPLKEPAPGVATDSGIISLSGNEVLIWLDEQTPLYMTLSPTLENGGS